MQVYSKRQPQPRILLSHCFRNGLKFLCLHSQTSGLQTFQTHSYHCVFLIDLQGNYVDRWCFGPEPCCHFDFFHSFPCPPDALISQIHRRVILIFKYNSRYFWCLILYDLAITSFSESTGNSVWFSVRSCHSPTGVFHLFTVHSGIGLHRRHSLHRRDKGHLIF